jgi:cold shock CspA family protein
MPVSFVEVFGFLKPVKRCKSKKEMKLWTATKGTGMVVRFGHLKFGIILDFKTKKEHFFHAKDCIGRKDFIVGDRVSFQLGESRKVRDRETRAEIYRARAIHVRLIAEQGTPVRGS